MKTKRNVMLRNRFVRVRARLKRAVRPSPLAVDPALPREVEPAALPWLSLPPRPGTLLLALSTTR